LCQWPLTQCQRAGRILWASNLIST
jgi:hypothetical protein